MKRKEVIIWAKRIAKDSDILVVIGISLYVFRANFKLAWAIVGFFLLAGAGFFAFNNYKLECTKDGLAMKFGLQQGTFKYERIKSIYISRFNETSYLPSLMSYNIVVRYIDNFNRIRELFFDAAFLDKEQVKEFLENFEIEDEESTKFANFEKWKIIRRVGKVVLIVAFVVLFGLVGYFYK